MLLLPCAGATTLLLLLLHMLLLLLRRGTPRGWLLLLRRRWCREEVHRLRLLLVGRLLLRRDSRGRGRANDGEGIKTTTAATSIRLLLLGHRRCLVSAEELLLVLHGRRLLRHVGEEIGDAALHRLGLLLLLLLGLLVLLLGRGLLLLLLGC